MSKQSQIKNMKLLADLLRHDLGYLYGDRESGPNEAKKHFLSIGRAFLSALGKDLDLAERKISVNKAGIAVSGEIYLRGLWRKNIGLYMCLEQDVLSGSCICYRSIQNMKDSKGGHNNFIHTSFLAKGDYEALLSMLLQLKESGHERKAA